MSKPITISDFKDCYYVPGELHIYDLIHPTTGLTLHFKKDEAAVKADKPGVVRMPFDDAMAQISEKQRAAYVKPVSEIRQEDFTYALEVLPPVGWRSARGVESFKMSERTCGNITGIFARCGDRFFAMSDSITLPAEEIADRVGAYIAEHPVAEPKAHFTL